jgi:hypothetical protein
LTTSPGRNFGGAACHPDESIDFKLKSGSVGDKVSSTDRA